MGLNQTNQYSDGLPLCVEVRGFGWEYLQVVLYDVKESGTHVTSASVGKCDVVINKVDIGSPAFLRRPFPARGWYRHHGHEITTGIFP